MSTDFMGHSTSVPAGSSAGMFDTAVVVRPRNVNPIPWPVFLVVAAASGGAAVVLDGVPRWILVGVSAFAFLLTLSQISMKRMFLRLDDGRLTYDTMFTSREIRTAAGGGHVVRLTIAIPESPPESGPFTPGFLTRRTMGNSAGKLAKALSGHPVVVQIWIGADGFAKGKFFERAWDKDALDRLREQAGLPLEEGQPVEMLALNKAYPNSKRIWPSMGRDWQWKLRTLIIGFALLIGAIKLAWAFIEGA